jgi:hypothetical protein
LRWGSEMRKLGMAWEEELLNTVRSILDVVEVEIVA